MTPTVGRIVHYRLTAADAEAVNRRRADAFAKIENMRKHRPGFQAHIGNPASEGQTVAMMIVAVWGDDCVNGQVFLDGNDSLWVTSRMYGPEPGEWRWAPRIEGAARARKDQREPMESLTAVGADG